MGLFLLFMGLDKTEWLMDDGMLRAELERWRGLAPAAGRWYLESIAIPGAPLFARLVFVGELASGAALLLGYRVRLAASVALLMILNFHFASGIMFTSGYMTNGYGLPVLGGLVALSLGGVRLPYSVTLTRG